MKDRLPSGVVQPPALEYDQVEDGFETLPNAGGGLMFFSPDGSQDFKGVIARDLGHRYVPDYGKGVGGQGAVPLRRVLGLLHMGRRRSITLEAASANVGMEGEGDRAASRASCFSKTGSRPSATAVRFSWAISRALAKLVAGYDPKPMSRLRPSITMRCTQDLLLAGAMFRQRPFPSPCLPGLLRALAANAVSLPIGSPYHIFSHTKCGMQTDLWELVGPIKGSVSVTKIRREVY